MRTANCESRFLKPLNRLELIKKEVWSPVKCSLPISDFQLPDPIGDMDAIASLPTNTSAFSTAPDCGLTHVICLEPSRKYCKHLGPGPGFRFYSKASQIMFRGSLFFVSEATKRFSR